MDFTETHHLGPRAFSLFLGKRLKWPLLFLLVLAGLWMQEDRIPVEYELWSDFGFKFLFMVWVGFMTFILLRSFFEYRGYSFRFDDEFFNVSRGYFTKNEMGIVYHQIQHVTVRRGILDRAVGVAHLIIVTNQGASSSSDSHIVLPALDKTKARLVQRELLRKAHRHMSQVYSPDKNVDDADEEEEESEDEGGEE